MRLTHQDRINAADDLRFHGFTVDPYPLGDLEEMLLVLNHQSQHAPSDRERDEAKTALNTNAAALAAARDYDCAPA